MDESQDAAAYAEELDLEFRIRMFKAGSALDLFEDVIQASTEPTADFSMFPTLLVSQFASESVKVVLTGDGGDEPFWGYVGRFVPMLEQAAYFKKPLAARYAAIAARKFLGVGYATREVLYPNVGRLFQKKHTLMIEKDLEQLFPNLNPLPERFNLFEYRGTDLDQTAQWLRWNEFTMHLQRVLMKADRASMHCSLETRLPLLDKEVLVVAAQTDWQTCLDLEKRLGKIPLRKLLSRHVKHQTHAKKGFTVPMHQWLQGPLQDLLQEKVIHRKGFLGQPVNQGHLARVNTRLLDGDRSKAWGLWLLLSLVLWEEKHLLNHG
jgi:asparagine synthase (glutamine-hydrolysing)